MTQNNDGGLPISSVCRQLVIVLVLMIGPFLFGTDEDDYDWALPEDGAVLWQCH
jgi:hypothetical protein